MGAEFLLPVGHEGQGSRLTASWPPAFLTHKGPGSRFLAPQGQAPMGREVASCTPGKGNLATCNSGDGTFLAFVVYVDTS